MQESFDALTREIARAPSRREALKAFGRGLVALFITSIPGARTALAADIDQANCRDQCSKACTTVTAGRVRTDLVCVRQCVANQCVPASCPPGDTGMCDGDPVTVASLDAARAALASGVNEGALSPNGCVRYRRQLDSSGRVTSQTILHAGMPVLVWNHSATQSTSAMDLDRNGCPNWRSTVRRGSSVNNDYAVRERLEDATGKALTRETYTRTNDVVHVTLEEADSSGALRTVAKFDTTLFEDAPFAGAVASIAAASVTTTGCSPEQAQRLQDRLRDGVATGLTCMQHFHGGDIATTVAFNYTFRPIVIRCATLPTQVAARVSNRSFYDPTTDIEISVNGDRFFNNLSDYEQGKVLWHEMLHLHFGPHNKKARSLSRFDEYDPTTACEDLCFGPADVSKCKCASCLKTTKCDQRCAIYQNCDSNLGYICPCPTGPNAFKYFDECTDCLVACPSGLACFGFSRCSPVTVMCDSEAPAPCP